MKQQQEIENKLLRTVHGARARRKAQLIAEAKESIKKRQSHITNTPLGPKRGYKGTTTNVVRTHQVFLDADCRYMIDGLLKVCSDAKIDVTDKPVGNLIVFVNTSRTLIKVIACNGTIDPVLGVYRIPPGYPHGAKFDLSVISEIPKAFGYGGHLDIQEAMKLALEKKLRKVVH